MMTPENLLYAAVIALGGVVTFLYRINREANQKTEKRADRIEEKYDESAAQQLKMSKEIGELQGEIGLAKKVVPKIEALHNDFLEAFPKK